MLSPLRNRTYRRLFAAQIIALIGTGLATVALGLLAYRLAGQDAGLVLGTALAIKMIAYVGLAPIAGAFAEWLPRRAFLIALDLVRAAIVLLLPFVDQVWQIYVLIFILQSASAAFTPTFQATIPDILPEEAEYTKALSLSRLAYDLENLASPALAAALLSLMSFHWLFAGTAISFALSALLVRSVVLPAMSRGEPGSSFYERTTKGIRYYLATPRLQGLLALNLTVAAAGAMVLVNTVVYVRGILKGDDTDVALALAVFGAGSMAAALSLPKLLERLSDRPVMLFGAAGLVLGLVVAGVAFVTGQAGWTSFLIIWLILGVGYSCVLTPSGRLIRRSSLQEDRPALYAAQFALSHACWMLTYPLAGWLGAAAGMETAFFVLALLGAGGAAAALLLWPARDPESVAHVHRELPRDHPHLKDAQWTSEGAQHVHPFIIDKYHRHWPGKA